MKVILKSVLKMIGAKKLILLSWELVKPELVRLAKKTENTDLDDRAIEVFEDVLKTLVGDSSFKEYVADAKLHGGEKSSMVA